MLRSSTDLPAPGAPDDAEDLFRLDLHVQSVMHELRAEAIDQPLHFDARHHQKSSAMNSVANSASASSTAKIDCTTATVVNRPSSREEPCTCKPRYVPARPISMPNTGAFSTPAQKVVDAIASFIRLRYCGNGMSSRYLHSSAPPVSPTASAMTVSSGNAMVSARMRGSTSTSYVSTPMACSASTSSFRRIEPISAANALPERPA